MKVGHTLFYFKTGDDSRNATVYRDTTAHIEGAVLVTVAVVGGLGNLLILGATAVCAKFRTTSCAFLSHHCILDSIKSIFCIPFACALLLDVDIPYCNALGATYIFLMTLTAYNLLAIHINEEYQLTDRQGYIPGHGISHRDQHKDTKTSFWCVSFGIFMIWFTTVLLHLGVAFLPSSAEFNYDIGNCVFNYGTPKNYVIHILWTMLVTLALVIAIICFALFFCKLRARMHSDKWALLHASMSRDMSRTFDKAAHSTWCDNNSSQSPEQTQALQPETEELHYEFAEVVDQTATRQMKLCLRRVVVMLLMVISFLIFWYPLFILTIMDVSYTRPPQAYRACMVIAWTHPVTTPLFCGIIYFDMLNMEALTKSAYSAAMPLKDSTSFSSVQRHDVQYKLHHRYNMYDMGFTNENFSFSNNGSPRNMHQGTEHGSCSNIERGKSASYTSNDIEIHSASVPLTLHYSNLSEGHDHSGLQPSSNQDGHQTLSNRS